MNVAFDNRRVAVLTWMVGANVALTLSIAAGLLASWSRLGEVSGQLAFVARAGH